MTGHSAQSVHDSSSHCQMLMLSVSVPCATIDTNSPSVLFIERFMGLIHLFLQAGNILQVRVVAPDS